MRDRPDRRVDQTPTDRPKRTGYRIGARWLFGTYARATTRDFTAATARPPARPFIHSSVRARARACAEIAQRRRSAGTMLFYAFRRNENIGGRPSRRPMIPGSAACRVSERDLFARAVRHLADNGHRRRRLRF